MKRLFAAVIFAFAFLNAPSIHAYVDPGTGAMAVELIVAGLVVAFLMLFFAIKAYLNKHKQTIARMFGQDSDD